MKDLGKYLKTTRIDNGVSIEEAAEDLELSTSQIENIESGNTKAFKDVYSLKQYVRSYAKYLGLDSEKVIDEFNDFLFEHTSKISLDDILEAQKKIDANKEKKVTSPYTNIPKEKVNVWSLIVLVISFIIVFVVIYFIVSFINKAPVRNSELINHIEKSDVYEFTY